MTVAKINKTSLSDTPFSESINDFGTERYVNGLVRFIENSSAPITIALQGEWGSGKTSMMTRLETALCSNNAPFIGVKIATPGNAGNSGLLAVLGAAYVLISR